MTKENQDFSMYAGDTKYLDCTVKDEDEVVVDIDTMTIRWSLGEAVTKSTASGIAITDGDNGVFRVTIDPADTRSLVGSFPHEASVETAGGDISTVLIGTATISASIISEA